MIYHKKNMSLLREGINYKHENLGSRILVFFDVVFQVK